MLSHPILRRRLLLLGQSVKRQRRRRSRNPMRLFIRIYRNLSKCSLRLCITYRNRNLRRRLEAEEDHIPLVLETHPTILPRDRANYLSEGSPTFMVLVLALLLDNLASSGQKSPIHQRRVNWLHFPTVSHQVLVTNSRITHSRLGFLPLTIPIQLTRSNFPFNLCAMVLLL